MKRIIVLLLCLLAVFAMVSCKEEPEEAETPAIEENGGTIAIKPAVENPDDPESTINWGTQDNKIQFVLDQAIEDDQDIAFLLKTTSEVTSFQVRNSDDYATWLKVDPISSCEKDSEGWYIVEIDGEDTVTESSGLGFTAYVSSQTENIEIQIKNLKIGGKLIDFSTWDTDTCVGPMVGAEVPSALSATITK